MDILSHEKPIYEYLKTIEHLKKQHQDSPIFANEIKRLEAKLEELKASIYKNLTPWERIQICRHPKRPHTLDYISLIVENFTELSGDRLYHNDEAIVGGLGIVGGVKCVIIGQEKGNSTETRVKHNFGMLNPEGFRKALRLMQLAEKFQLPVLSLIDTPGAFPGLEAEERGQGWAIAYNLREMARLKTPIVVVIIGEGCSGGALGMAVGDTIAMLENSYYSVISPEGCASILWKDSTKNALAADALKLTAQDLLNFKIIDQILPEPVGGAHYNPKAAADEVKNYFVEQVGALKHLSPELLLEQRFLKYRALGEFERDSS